MKSKRRGVSPQTAQTTTMPSARETRNCFLDDFDLELRGLKPTPTNLDFDPVLSAKHVKIAGAAADYEPHPYLIDQGRKPFVMEPIWKAAPGTEVVNPATGEITTVPRRVPYRGGDISLSKLAQQLEGGTRQARATLATLGMLAGELEAKMVPLVSDKTKLKPEYSDRQRLTEWAVKMGYGRRVKGGAGYGMDWITPSGLAYIEMMLALPIAVRDAVGTTVTIGRPKAIDVIRKLLDGNPTMQQAEIVRRTGLSKMTVHRNRLLLAAKVTSDSCSVI